MGEHAESLRLDRFTAEFYYPETERDFRHYIRDNRIREVRLAIGLASLFYLAFALSDSIVMRGLNEYGLVLTLRLLVCTVGLGAVIIGQKYWWHLLNGLIPTIVVVSGLVAFLVSTLLVPLQYGVHGMGMMAMLLGVYVFIPNRYILVVSVSLVASVIFVVILANSYALNTGTMATVVAIAVVTNILGSMTNYRLSRMMREEFREQIILKEANLRLQVEMQERSRLEEVLRHRAEVDDVTGAPNRATFFSQVDDILFQSDVVQEPLAVLVVDVDYFKQINLTYGYARSDEVLKALVMVCNAVLGERRHFLARIGGEEFVILLPGMDLSAGAKMADRIRAECQRTPVAMDEVNVHFTVSIGVALHQPGEAARVAMRQADEAMTSAKFKGRNRVETAHGGTS
jgi:diguanylate cyclase (GGDEF)-like protein